jgi:uncharacterized protein YeaO (DUF488 family)
MPIRTKCIYEKAEPADGYRVLVMRLWPRGIRKDAVDAWDRELGTPTELIKEWKSGSVPWAEFARRYRASMRGQQERMAGLADRAERANVTLLCGCRDESRCHRLLLKELIQKAARPPKRRLETVAAP